MSTQGMSTGKRSKKSRPKVKVDPDLIGGGLINDRSGRATRRIRQQHGIKSPKKRGR